MLKRHLFGRKPNTQRGRDICHYRDILLKQKQKNISWSFQRGILISVFQAQRCWILTLQTPFSSSLVLPELMFAVNSQLHAYRSLPQATWLAKTNMQHGLNELGAGMLQTSFSRSDLRDYKICNLSGLYVSAWCSICSLCGWLMYWCVDHSG